MSQEIIVLGSINMDLVVRAPRLPRLGETILGGEFQTFPGGKGANQAVACARLGGRVRMIGKVGEDAFGKSLVAGIAQNGVDVSAVEVDSTAATGVAFITVTHSGDNAIVVAPGANGRVTAEDVLRWEEQFANASVLVLQLECPLAAVEKAIEIAQAHSVRVVLNPAPAQALPEKLLQSVDTLIPNETELAFLTGETELKAGIERLRKAGVRNLVVTLGEKGAVLVSGEQHLHMPAYSVQAVDTTAAGDAFVGAYAVAVCEGKSTQEAAQWGMAAGALAVTKAGAQPSLPHREELLQFIHRHPAAGIVPLQ
ncbi:MAG: ribokinase [Chloroflexota bacterium]